MDYWEKGFIFGMGLAVIIAIIFKFRKNMSEKMQYDERQIIARGQAYKYAFFTLLIYLTAYTIFDMAEIRFCENVIGIFIGMFISICVFVCTAIIKDAYVGIKQNIKSWIGLNLIVIVANTAAAIVNITEGKVIENGMLSHGATNILVIILFTVILITLLVHNRKKAEDDE